MTVLCTPGVVCSVAPGGLDVSGNNEFFARLVAKCERRHGDRTASEYLMSKFSNRDVGTGTLVVCCAVGWGGCRMPLP